MDNSLYIFRSLPVSKMSNNELEIRLQNLDKRQAEIEEELKTLAHEDKGNYAPVVEDLGNSIEDAAQEAAELDRTQALVENLKHELEEVKLTKEKIKTGKYGVCDNCSNNIEEPRLKAIPAASLCVNCARKADLL